MSNNVLTIEVSLKDLIERTAFINKMTREAARWREVAAGIDWVRPQNNPASTAYKQLLDAAVCRWRLANEAAKDLASARGI